MLRKVYGLETVVYMPAQLLGFRGSTRFLESTPRYLNPAVRPSIDAIDSKGLLLVVFVTEMVEDTKGNPPPPTNQWVRPQVFVVRSSTRISAERFQGRHFQCATFDHRTRCAVSLSTHL